MKKILLAIAALAAGVQAFGSTAPAASIKSPDGNLELSFWLEEGGVPKYSLTHKGDDVVLPSLLGFELRGTVKAEKISFEGDEITKTDVRPCYSFAEGFELTGTETDTFDEVWEPVWGEESQIRNHYNELLVKLRQTDSDKLMNVRFRLFDDGLGFRYEFPSGQPLTYFVIKEELTEFAMAGDHFSWWIPGDYDTQEYEYGECRLSEISENFQKQVVGNSSQTFFSTSGVQTSFQMKTDDGLYINIHEAALVDYPCMHLLVDGDTHVLRSWLTPDAQGWKGYMQTPCNTPWRTVQVAESATEQLASRLVLNLNEPCAYDDVSWIHPVKYMGVWWEMIAGYGRQLRLHQGHSQRTPLRQQREGAPVHRLRGRERIRRGARGGLEHRLGGLVELQQGLCVRLRDTLPRLRHRRPQRLRPLQGHRTHHAPRDLQLGAQL